MQQVPGIETTEAKQEADQQLIDLLSRCALREQQALRILYDRLAPYLNGVAFRIVKSRELSNEVLQEGFVQIWQNAGEYRPHKAKALTWITSIIRYRALDKLDKEKRHQHNTEIDTVSDSNIVSLQTKQRNAREPEQDMVDIQSAGKLKACLGKLPAQSSECIQLAYLHGYSREELASRYDTKVNTIKSWLRRAAEKLRLCLENQLEADV